MFAERSGTLLRLPRKADGRRASARPDSVALPASRCARERRTSHLFRIVPEYLGSELDRAQEELETDFEDLNRNM